MPTPLPANPFMIEAPFVLDADRFMEAIEPAPKFIADPSKEYLDAIDFDAIVDVLRKY